MDKKKSKNQKSENKEKIIKSLPRWIILIPLVSILVAMVISSIPSISEAADKT